MGSEDSPPIPIKQEVTNDPLPLIESIGNDDRELFWRDLGLTLKVEVICGSYRIMQDRDSKDASQSLIGLEVLRSILIAEKKLDGAVTIDKLTQQTKGFPMQTIHFQGSEIRALGPYVIPITLDGVEIYMPVMVSVDPAHSNLITLGAKALKPYLAAIGAIPDMT